jgi:hypothetical protein
MLQGLTLEPRSLDELAATIYQLNKAKGFYDEPTEIGTRLALIHSEVSEALESDRAHKYADKNSALTALELESDAEFQVFFQGNVKDTFQDEIADAIIRLLDLSGYLKLDIESHVYAKLRFNSLRPYKHGKSY